MTDRIRQFVRQRPKTLIVMVVCIVILVSGVLYAVYALLSNPEFPSERTPLSLVANGLKWTAEGATPDQYHSTYGDDRGGIRFSLGDARWWLTSNDSLMLNSGHPTTVFLGTRIAGDLTLSLDLNDATGDGSFGQGDYFVVSFVNGSGFAEEATYTLVVTWTNAIITLEKCYSLVVDEGVLYAWDSTPKNVLVR